MKMTFDRDPHGNLRLVDFDSSDVPFPGHDGPPHAGGSLDCSLCRRLRDDIVRDALRKANS